MKHNPLFVDSTKVHGDSVPTIFELYRIFLYEGEKVYLYVEESNGNFHREVLKFNEKNQCWSTYLYLAHQTRVRFQYIIKNNDEVVFKSQQYSDLAKYNLETQWSPCLDVELLEPKKDTFKPKRKEFVANGYSSSHLEKIIKKWGF